METPLGPYEKEYMKMAMLKHEETFKQQVYELHRLYRIQKILMKSIGSGVHAFAGNNTSSANSNSCRMDNKAVAILNYMKLQQQEEEIRPAEDSDNGVAEEAADAIEESQVELTLGLGPATTTYYHNKSKKRGSTSDSIPSSFSSSSTGSTRSFDIHHQHRDSESQVKFGSHLDGAAVVEEEAERMKQYPPWIFQVLRLNST